MRGNVRGSSGWFGFIIEFCVCLVWLLYPPVLVHPSPCVTQSAPYITSCLVLVFLVVSSVCLFLVSCFLSSLLAHCPTVVCLSPSQASFRVVTLIVVVLDFCLFSISDPLKPLCFVPLNSDFEFPPGVPSIGFFLNSFNASCFSKIERAGASHF